MPVHQLAKRGEEEIRIIERSGPSGQINLHWKVEPNLALGRPGQLAYHLDTLVIKRRLDERARPVPRLIEIGDLRSIARELRHGGDTNAIKRAFEQNASTFIRAKVEYRNKEGQKEWLEGYFNRYNVFYRGQRLPGGRTAETVYISLNDPYYALINNSPWRPLDYGYLKQLRPTAQRFYELLSLKMFAALKNGHPRARVRYSEYCRYAAQKRQPDKRRMQIQMAPIHRPHLASGYLAAVSYQRAPVEEDVPDWFLEYVPGPRACAEYDTFNSTSGGPTRGLQAPKAIPVQKATERPQEGTRKANSATSESCTHRNLAQRFYRHRYGTEPVQVTHRQLEAARAILAAAKDPELASLAVELAARQGRDQSFPKHIGGVLEGNFLDEARRARDEEASARQSEASRQRERTRRDRYETWCRQRSEDRIKALTPDERHELIDRRLADTVHAFRFYLGRQPWSADRVRDWAAPRILNRYGREGEPTYLEWCKNHVHGPSPDGEALH